ncbi:MAG: hypothetical protein ACFFDN_24620 [Candidatus Hodarchaeota archaeon]
MNFSPYIVIMLSGLLQEGISSRTFVGSLFIILMLAVWIIHPQGVDLVSSSIILLIFASFFIILGIVFIVKRETLLERRLAKADRFF